MKKTALAGEGGEGKMYSAGTPNTATGGGRAPQSALCGFCIVVFALSKWLLKILKLRNKPIFGETMISDNPLMRRKL